MAALMAPVLPAPNDSKKHGHSRAQKGRTASLVRVHLQEEKELLAGLNSRLAAYIDQVRYLQAENSQLSCRVVSFEDTVQKEVGGVRRLFETELSDARILLDSLAREKAQLQIDVGKFRSEAEDWMLKHNRKERDFAALQEKLLESEARAAQLEAKALEAWRLRDHWESECTRLNEDLCGAHDQLGIARRQLEQETLLRVDLENKLKSLQEELAFSNQLHETELSGCQERLEISIQDCSSDGAGDQESFYRALVDFRKDYDVQFKLRCSELEAFYAQKIASLKSELAKSVNVSKEATTAANAHLSHIAELQGSMKELATLNEAVEKRVQLLEAELVSQQESARQLLAEKDSRLKLLLDDIEQQARSYNDLLDIKLSLDVELAAYRRLLDDEECRLGVPNHGRIGSAEHTGSDLPRKRPRRSDYSSSSRDAVQSSSATISSSNASPIEIAQVDLKTKLIKLHNNAGKEISLGSWIVSVQDCTGYSLAYKFNRTVKISPSGDIQVWGMGSGMQGDSRASTYVMKEGEWLFSNGAVKVVLLNKEAQEVANAEVSKDDSAPERSVISEADSATAFVPNKERCVVM